MPEQPHTNTGIAVLYHIINLESNKYPIMSMYLQFDGVM